MTPPTKQEQSAFWTINAGHLATIMAMLLSGMVVYTQFVSTFTQHDARITSLERADVIQSALPSRVTVVETRLDTIQAQLVQLNTTSNRNADAMLVVREDLAAIKAKIGQAN